MIDNNSDLTPEHKAGFVSIIGKPNVGKSTLMNLLLGEKLSIISPKAQTTRHRIMGMLNDEHYQIVYSDTPGIIKPNYMLQKKMMDYVVGALEDADVLIWVIDIMDKEDNEGVFELLQKVKVENPETKLLVILNKIDLVTEAELIEKVAFFKEKTGADALIPISALHRFNHQTIFQTILDFLPNHPPFFPKDELTDRSERFFASEIIREKIFKNYDQEIPYATEVRIESFKQKPDILVIMANIFVERESQKGIIIGKSGEMLKKVGREARESLEEFFGSKVFLETHVKVEQDWRKNEQKLDKFGYSA